MAKKKAIIIEDKKNDEKEAEKPKEEKLKRSIRPKTTKLYVQKYLVKAEGVDVYKYDYVAERPPGHKAKLFEAVAHLVSNSLGACVMCINELFMKCGLIGSIITNIFLSCTMSYCLYSLTSSAHKVYEIAHVPLMTYPELAQASMDISTYPVLKKYGGRFKYAVIAAIVVRLFAKCCVYQLVLARGLDQFLNHKQWCNPSPYNIRKYLAALLIPCILICMLRTLDYTAPFSMVSHMFIIILAFYIISCLLMRAPKSFNIYQTFYSATDFFSLCGGFLFTMDTSCAVLSVENTMEVPRKIYLVIIIGMSVVTAMVVSMGVSGLYGWGLRTQAPITVNFDKMPYSVFFKLGFLFSAYNSFALEFWVLFNLIWFKLKKMHSPERFWIFERMYRAVFVFAITILGITFPDISGIMSLFGALADGVLNFIFPPVIEFLVSTREQGFGKYKWKVLRVVAITTFGWILVLCGCISGLLDIFASVYGVS